MATIQEDGFQEDVKMWDGNNREDRKMGFISEEEAYRFLGNVARGELWPFHLQSYRHHKSEMDAESIETVSKLVK